MRLRDEHKEDIIRKKTIELIVKEGLDGFSMQKLAKAAGVSPATLYIYYTDKEDLILKICLEVTQHMAANSLENFDADMHFEEGLRIQWKNRAAYFMKYPVEVQFIELMRYTQLYDKVAAMMVKSFGEIMGRFVHKAIERKELVQLPFEVFWSVAFAPLYQLIKFHTQGKSYVNKEFVLVDNVMQQTLQLVLKALKP
jgi:AcrR family transcriptional regulator